jgi:hypothetical protein
LSWSIFITLFLYFSYMLHICYSVLIFFILFKVFSIHYFYIFNTYYHRWASTSSFMLAISDIGISYSDIGTKYVRLNPLIPISEEFWYRHQLPFGYRTKLILDIPISKIDKSFPKTRIKFYYSKFFSLDSNTETSCDILRVLHCATRVYK